MTASSAGSTVPFKRHRLAASHILLIALGAASAVCLTGTRPAAGLEGPPREKAAHKVPNFYGTARRVLPVSHCPALLKPDLHDPFNSGEESVTSRLYRLTGCWTGTLEGKKFVIDQYFDQEAGGGLVIEFGDAPPVAAGTGLARPDLFRFTGQTVCHVERAGARVVAVNIRTGSVIVGDDAEEICAPPPLPVDHVLGLSSRR